MTEHPSARLEDAVHQRVRLGILALLAEVPRVEFLAIRDALGLTNGNTSRHLSVLEEEGYVALTKTFEGRRPKTLVSLTAKGRKALETEIHTLTELTERFKTKTRPDAAAIAATAAVMASAEQGAPESPAVRELALLVVDDAPAGFEQVLQLGVDPGRWESRVADPLLVPSTVYVRAWASQDAGLLASAFAFGDASTAKAFVKRLNDVLSAQSRDVSSARVAGLAGARVHVGPFTFTNVRTGRQLRGGAVLLFARGRHAFDLQAVMPGELDAAREAAIALARRQCERLEGR